MAESERADEVVPLVLVAIGKHPLGVVEADLVAETELDPEWLRVVLARANERNLASLEYNEDGRPGKWRLTPDGVELTQGPS